MKTLIEIQNEVITKYRITINTHSKCRSRMHAHIRTRMVCKWEQKSSIQATFDLFHEVGHIETTKSWMRRAESEYYATVWAIDKFIEYGLQIPNKIMAAYQRYIEMERDRGERRGGKGYGELDLYKYAAERGITFYERKEEKKNVPTFLRNQVFGVYKHLRDYIQEINWAAPACDDETKKKNAYKARDILCRACFDCQDVFEEERQCKRLYNPEPIAPERKPTADTLWHTMEELYYYCHDTEKRLDRLNSNEQNEVVDLITEKLDRASDYAVRRYDEDNEEEMALINKGII